LALTTGGVKPMEYGGNSGTAALTKAVIDAIPIALIHINS